MTKLRDILGYVLGGLLFVLLIPAVMWFASGRPAIAHVSVLRTSLAVLMMFGGLAMSIWTIVYMRQRGKGNPMDAFGHEVAPRTQHLMTDGPYRINRNPMLTGTLLYLAGFVVLLCTWQSALVWLIFIAIMMVQVINEERRLHRDFGQEYDTYRRHTRRF